MEEKLKQKQKEEKLKPQQDKIIQSSGLVYSAEGKIYLFVPEAEDIVIAERENDVWALCFHN